MSVHHGRKGIREQSIPHHGSQEAEKKGIQEEARADIAPKDMPPPASSN
jgi:hypothetical protein